MTHALFLVFIWDSFPWIHKVVGVMDNVAASFQTTTTTAE